MENSPDFAGVALMLMQWGQLVDHDVTLTPLFTGKLECPCTLCHLTHRLSPPAGHKRNGIECCTATGDFMPQQLRHPSCMPIEIPPSDRFYGPRNIKCMNFVRSMPGPRPDCDFGYVEQVSFFFDSHNFKNYKFWHEVRGIRTQSKN